MSNYDGKIELPQTYHNQGNEQYLSSDKPDTYLWLAEENTKQENEIKRLQEQLADASKTIDQIADLSKKVERLQEQLNEANNIIKQYCFYEYGKPYLKKWGVK